LFTFSTELNEGDTSPCEKRYLAAPEDRGDRTVAVQLRAQVPRPVQTGTLSQPPKAVPVAWVAVSVTVWPWGKALVQAVAAAWPPVMVYEMPIGVDFTTPLPVPEPETVRV
jgi:hypothetical protein